MTYADCITDALRMIGVLSLYESADADQGTHGLMILNDMMAKWESDGIMVGYAQNADLSADLNLAPIARQAVKQNLAIQLCPTYGRQPSAILVASADTGLSMLNMNAAIGQQQESDLRDVPRGSGHGGRLDITTGRIV